MEVVCHLGEPFWRPVGQRRLTLSLPESSTAADALALLGQQWPDLGRLLRGEQPQELTSLGPLGRQGLGLPLPLRLLLNSRVAPTDRLAQTPLQDGDRLYLILPTVGG
ncbi:MAG: MoaD/ThiS family protein [Chloroflexi bacterium]|nr:MoaD/ThiS family protein [Chloroflexota bacterium]